jgi:hypothetical protein
MPTRGSANMRRPFPQGTHLMNSLSFMGSITRSHLFQLRVSQRLAQGVEIRKDILESFMKKIWVVVRILSHSLHAMRI